ncbi:MAG: endonuclease III, partial [Sphingomonadaceae bacterium]|nr:endonuclease III [Sphingomonadaceae bacterium]
MTKPQIEDFFARLTQAIPDPKSDLEYSNAYTLLVAVVLSAQATDAGV